MPSIYSRQKNEQGKWRYVRVKTGPGRRPADLDGPFYLRVTTDGREQWVSVGDTLEDAKQEAGKHKAMLEAEASGLVVENEAANRLRTRIEAYNAETKANKARKTGLAYANTLRYFTESCHKTYVEDITREDMLAFKTHLRHEKLSDGSIYNNFLNTMVFLKWCGVKVGVKKYDWPPQPEREPEEYSEDELTALLNAADAEADPQALKSPRHERSQPDERLVINSFLCSALRAGELSHLTYGNIDFQHSVWTVVPKTLRLQENVNRWKPKTKTSQRDVPVPAWLTEKIYKRMMDGDHQKSDLIFPSRDGKPDRKLLNVVKRVAKRAKVTGRVDDHKFRSTAITRWLRNGNTVPDVMAWVGHVKPETILRYAAKVNIRKAENRKRADGAFAQFAGVGD
jgi:integrase